ncbi:MAG: PHP domain-containing protein, partial [Oscillospiraceae bacterium]|nr:PHP domain-containing protein [Oscillospiraceae bacterium]
MPTFQQTFANCPFPEGVLAVLGSFPAQVRVLKAQRAMEVAVSGTNVSRETLAQAEECLKRAFGLSTATVDVNELEPAAPAGVEQPPAPEPDSSQSAPELSVPAPPGDLEAQMAAMRRKLLRADTPAAGKGKKKVRQIYGKISGKKKPVPMNELTLDMGSVLVEGEVFNVEHRELTRRKAWVVCFDLTDLTSSIRITRFMEGEEAKPIIDQVKKGQRLQVQGRLTLGRFDNNDLVMEPYGINEVPKPEGRQDTAPDKRVELHLHTKMSTMDALCDTKAVVKRAIEWGHPAIAITDHGVVQSFPDAYSASGRGEKIKVLYGVEAYYQNDVDEQAAVHGPGDMPLDGEFVAFDLETTGLDARADAIIEIGAVRVRGGEVVDKFASFAQPGRPLSAKTVALTGITDEMLKGAPAPEEAVDAFLDWVGDTPLCAHNAAFDTGFIREYCFRAGRRFDPLYFDTLILAQYLCPKLPNHKLDTVASALGLPPFQHHRAYDDAETCGLILAALVPLLREQGVERAAQINRVFAGKRRGGRGRRSAFHLIVLAKNQTGLRNLYKLVYKAHLEHFN